MEKGKRKEMEKKIRDLKIELLKQPQKRGTIRREVARALTAMKQIEKENQTKLEEKK